MKRMLTTVAIAVLLLAVLTSGSYAFFTVENTARNAITSGNIEFEIHEVNDKGEVFPLEGINVLPGDKVSKIVSAQNTGKKDMFIRVKLIKSVKDSELPAENQIIVDTDSENWTYEDGYYYYNKAIAPGEETTPLFKEVTIDGESVGNEYIGKSFLLEVKGDALQTKNIDAEALKSIGWSTAPLDEN